MNIPNRRVFLQLSNREYLRINEEVLMAQEDVYSLMNGGCTIVMFLCSNH